MSCYEGSKEIVVIFKGVPIFSPPPIILEVFLGGFSEQMQYENAEEPSSSTS